MKNNLGKEIMTLFFLFIFLLSCSDQLDPTNNDVIVDKTRRLFSDSSFWNQALPKDVEVDPMSDKWIKLLEQYEIDHFDFNNTAWTIPIYSVDSTTQRFNVSRIKLSDAEKKVRLSNRNYYGHGNNFNPVPIPAGARADHEKDAHFAVIDWDEGMAWDIWTLKKTSDSSWASYTGMKYSIDGDGIFNMEDYNGIKDDESVHFFGPSRAAGVPAIAGVVMYNEVMSGEIKHKLACATRFNALQEFTYPATWTDGWLKGGIPEGAIIQLDPALDLSQFNLTDGEIIVAKAAQKYGMVVVDNADGQPIYCEGLWGHKNKSWKNILPFQTEGLKEIKYKYYRIVKVKDLVKGKGDVCWSKKPHPFKVEENKI